VISKELWARVPCVMLSLDRSNMAHHSPVVVDPMPSPRTLAQISQTFKRWREGKVSYGGEGVL
jgi:hypothetical protein